MTPERKKISPHTVVERNAPQDLLSAFTMWFDQHEEAIFQGIGLVWDQAQGLLLVEALVQFLHILC